MSFGISVSELVAAISLANQFVNGLNQERQQLHREWSQLVQPLDGLVEACKATDLDVVFITDFKVCIKNPLDTCAQANRLLLSTGLASFSRKRSNLEATLQSAQQSDSEGDARSLWNDLWQRAQQFRLILVCDVENCQIVREALRNDKWLRGRVFAITSFETHQHPGHRCQQDGTVCCSEEGSDLVLWSIIRLLEERKKQLFSENLMKLELSYTKPLGGLSALNGALRGDKLGRTQVTVRALQHVVFAFRPLHIDELLEALATDYTSTFECKDLREDKSLVHGQEDLTELMSEVLEVRDNGLVFFRDSDLRHRVLTQQIEPMEPSLWPNGHEVLATICLQHLQCFGRESVLKPWASVNSWLVEKGAKCRLHSYATAFWHEHYRLAENQSSHLPALLHRIISSAISMHKLDSKEHIVTLKDKTNSGLWVSAAYGLRTLCKTYLEMGADLHLTNDWHKHPFQILTLPHRQQHLRLSLGFGNGLSMAKNLLQAPRQCARFAARTLHENGQNELQRAFATCHGGDGGARGDLGHRGLSPFQMASVYGHSAILELFQEHTYFAFPSVQNGDLHHAVKLGQSEISCEASAVNARACEVKKELEERGNVDADCFSDVRRSFHSLSLAETTPWNASNPSTEECVTGAADCDGLVADDTPPEDWGWLFVTKEDVERG